jgi:hypothetical protein
MSSSQLNQSIVVVSLISTFFTAEFNTSSIESTSSISIFSVLKRHFELRYRLDFSDFLNLLIMKCMKIVIDFQQILKLRSYKKTINDSNRNEWLKIMKNENKFLLINEIWTLINFFKDRRIFRDKWVYKIKRNEHDEILRYKTRWMIRDFEQIEKLNYMKIFVSMIKLINYKIMYVIIVVNDWKIEQINVKIAFLYNKIHENVFVVQFTKFEQRINQICKLSQAAIQKQNCGITWCDYSHVMWLRWLCTERDNFELEHLNIYRKSLILNKISSNTAMRSIIYTFDKLWTRTVWTSAVINCLDITWSFFFKKKLNYISVHFH